MATPISRSLLKKKLHITSLRPLLTSTHVQNKRIARCKSITSASQINTVEDYYPQVKPKYPPCSKWNGVKPELAWEIYDAGRELKQNTKIKDRLEALGGFENVDLFKVKCFDDEPGMLKFKQYITKTTILQDKSTFSKQVISEETINSATSLLENCILQVNHNNDNLSDNATDSDSKTTNLHSSKSSKSKELFSLYLRSLVTLLSSNFDHLYKSQFDEDVRLETFWRCGGYTDDEIKDWATYQLQSRISHQIRIEKPLPMVIPRDDETRCCNQDIPKYNFHPENCAARKVESRPITVSGHWIDDPCEFTQLLCVSMGEEYYKQVEEYGQDVADNESLAVGLSYAFASAVAQAHNQGFTYFWDLTYPFRSQVVLTNGSWIQFLTYQLNTIQLFKPQEANPMCNLLWSTPRMSLYERIEDNQVQGINTDAIHQLMQFMTLEPVDMDVKEQRPHDAEQRQPHLTKCYIANKDDEQLPQFRAEQFDYPKNAIYY